MDTQNFANVGFSSSPLASLIKSTFCKATEICSLSAILKRMTTCWHSAAELKPQTHRWLLAFSCRIIIYIYILYSFWLICTNESSKTNIAMENGSFSSMIYLLNMLIFHVTSRNTRPVPERIPISMEWRFSPCPGPLFRAMLDVLRTVHYDRETGWNRRSKKAGRAPWRENSS